MEFLNRHAFCSLRFALCILLFVFCSLRFALCILLFAFCFLLFVFDQSDSRFFSNMSAGEKRQQWRKKAASSNSSDKVILSEVEEGKVNRTAQYHTPFVTFSRV